MKQISGKHEHIPVSQLMAEAAACLKNKDHEGALELLKALLDREPRQELALGLLASTYAELGMNDRALEFYGKVLDVNPVNPLARLQLGLLQYHREHWQEAIATWEPLLDDTDQFLAHYLSGLALMQLQRPREAHRLFIQAAATIPPGHNLTPEINRLLQATR